MDHINPPSLAPPIGKFTHIVTTPPGTALAFVSGQIGVDADTSTTPASCYDQTLLVFDNLGAVLEQLDVTPSSIIKMLTFIVGDDAFTDFARARDEVYAQWFPTGVYPAHSAAVVTGLARPDLTIELEAVIALTS